MENAISLNTSDSSLFEALWTLINRADDKVKRAIVTRIQNQIGAKGRGEAGTHAQFVQFIDSIPVQETNAVPAEASGIDALIDVKYKDLWLPVRQIILWVCVESCG